MASAPKRLIGPDGRFVSDPAKAGRAPAIERFAAKCEFDPVSGCVIWTGGRTSGKGNSAEYGSFWYEGRRWFAHRWAAVHIHGLDVGTDEVGHCCPAGPNSLCVEHLEATTKADNVAERNTRVAAAARAEQSSATRQYWLFVHLGIEPIDDEPVQREHGGVPFFEPPEWLRPYIPQPEAVDDDCPF